MMVYGQAMRAPGLLLLRATSALLLASLLGGCDPSYTWPTYQGGKEHTGYVSTQIDVAGISTSFSSAPGFADLPLNAATAAEGKVFTSERGYFDDDVRLMAVSAVTGLPIWHVSFDDLYSVNPPAYAKGVVFLQAGRHSNNTWLRAYDAADGTLLWESPFGAQWERYLAPTIDQGVVYINGGSYGGMYAFDAETGEQLWFANHLPQYHDWTPALTPQYALAYMGYGLYAVDRQTGEDAFVIYDWNYNWNGYSVGLAPVVGNQNDAYVAHNGRLVRFDLSAHVASWELDDAFEAQVALAAGVLYVANGGVLEARDALTGSLLWSWTPPGGEGVQGNVIVTDSHVIASTDAGTYLIDLATHDSVFSHLAHGHLSLAQERLLIAQESGFLVGIEMPALP